MLIIKRYNDSLETYKAKLQQRYTDYFESSENLLKEVISYLKGILAKPNSSRKVCFLAFRVF